MQSKIYKFTIDLLLAIIFILGSILIINILNIFTENYEANCLTMQAVLNIKSGFIIQNPLIFKILESLFWIIALTFPATFFYLSSNHLNTANHSFTDKLIPYLRTLSLVTIAAAMLYLGMFLTDPYLAFPYLAVLCSLIGMYIMLFKKDNAELKKTFFSKIYFKIFIAIILILFFLVYVYNIMLFTAINFPCLGGLPEIGE